MHAEADHLHALRQLTHLCTQSSEQVSTASTVQVSNLQQSNEYPAATSVSVCSGGKRCLNVTSVERWHKQKVAAGVHYSN